VAPAELRGAASWNLCPQESRYLSKFLLRWGIKHGSDCYFATDRTFDQLQATEHFVFDDVPDGEWEVRVAGDTFNKVGVVVAAAGCKGRACEPLTESRGGADEYMRCDLEARAPGYAGECEYASAGGAGAPGDVCDQLCECEGGVTGSAGCGAGGRCVCPECLAPDDEALGLAGRRRRALQSAGGDPLEEIMEDVLEQQGAVSERLAAMEKAQEEYAARQEAFYGDGGVLRTTMADGFTTLAEGQNEVGEKLDEVLERQREALEKMREAEARQRRLVQLQMRQQVGFDQIHLSTDSQLAQVDLALTQGKVTAAEADGLREVVRLAARTAAKENLLSSSPCQAGYRSTPFELANYEREVFEGAARKRTLGANNRVLSGVLLHVTRRSLTGCKSSDTKYGDLVGECTEGLTTLPYGVDPVFNLGTSQYELDMDTPETVRQYYNCSELEEAEYTEEGGNVAPWCLQLYRPTRVPYGFYHRAMTGYEPGFPVLVDINLNQKGAMRLLEYLSEGMYLEARNTKSVKASAVVYNAELRMFCYAMVDFDFRQSGLIQVTTTVDSMRLEPYHTKEDKVRLVLEVLLVAANFVATCSELYDIHEAKRYRGSYMAYFHSRWNYIDTLNIVLFWVGMGTWITFVKRYCDGFDPEVRYDVYDNIEARAYLTELRGSGEGLQAVDDLFQHMHGAARTQLSYSVIVGIIFMLLLMRMLKLMDFQPRLGVVTRTLSLASTDLLHFFAVFMVVFAAFGVVGHILLGPQLPAMSTLDNACRSLFTSLLGDFAWYDQFKVLDGAIYTFAELYFWSFQTFVVLIMLNFLLAIICDAFADVKDSAQEHVTVIDEVVPIAKNALRSLAHRLVPSAVPGYVSEAQLRQQLRTWSSELKGERPTQEKLKKAAEEENSARVVELPSGESLDKDQLTSILRAVKRNAAAAQKMELQQSPSGLNKFMFRGKSSKGLFGSKKAFLSSDGDVEKAASLILSQLGQGATQADVLSSEDRALIEALDNLRDGQASLVSQSAALHRAAEALLAQTQGTGEPSQAPGDTVLPGVPS